MRVSRVSKLHWSLLRIPSSSLASVGERQAARFNHSGAENTNKADGRVRFDSPEAVTRGKSTWEVFRGWLVFKLFTYDWLVDNNLKVGS